MRQAASSPARTPATRAMRALTFVGLSALLTTTMPAMKTTLEAIDAAGLRPGVKVIVGGAPVTQRFADSIAADGYGETATAAVDLARALIGAGAGAGAGAAGRS